jgi:hypothetical protein
MRENNRAENSPLAIRRRERKQQFKSQGSAQRFLASHAAVYNTFNTHPHLISRPGLGTLRAQPHEAWAADSAAARSEGWGRDRLGSGGVKLSVPGECGYPIGDGHDVQVLTGCGQMVARPGDWIVLSVSGDFHVARAMPEWTN